MEHERRATWSRRERGNSEQERRAVKGRTEWSKKDRQLRREKNGAG